MPVIMGLGLRRVNAQIAVMADGADAGLNPK
jgi:hypothetical protein